MLGASMTIVSCPGCCSTYNYSTSGTKGEDGVEGEPGQPGGSGGGAGTDAVSGVNGQHGTAAMPNTVCLISVPGQRHIVVSPKASETDATVLPLYDGSVRVNLLAMGGAGGKGGNGGRGKAIVKLFMNYFGYD
jgi:hypothetical protein